MSVPIAEAGAGTTVARLAGARAAARESAQVETLRGLACLLLVAFHVIGNDASMGLHVADDSGWRAFANSLIHLRMPLFTFLSGFVYAYRPATPGTAGEFARRKLWRLYVPLVVVSTLYFAVESVAPGVNTRPALADLPAIYVTSYAHFWFLQAILVIFALVALLERWAVLATLRGWALVFAASVLLFQSGLVKTDVFSLGRAVYLLPYFLLGLAANRHADALRHPALRAAAATAFALTMTLHVLASTGEWGQLADRRTWFATLLSASALLTLLYHTPPARWLEWIGGYSFTIYLYHVFFTAGARAALHGAGVAALPVHVALGVAAGVAGPIALEIVLRRSGVARRVLLGQR